MDASQLARACRLAEELAAAWIADPQDLGQTQAVWLAHLLSTMEGDEVQPEDLAEVRELAAAIQWPEPLRERAAALLELLAELDPDAVPAPAILPQITPDS